MELPPPLPPLPILLPPLPPATDATASPSLAHPPPEPLPAAKLINQRTLSSSPLSAACRRGVSPFLFCTCVRLLSIAYPCCVRIELRNAVYQHVMRGGVCVYKSQADLSNPAPYVQERTRVCVCARDVSVCTIFFTIVLCEFETHNYTYTIMLAYRTVRARIVKHGHHCRAARARCKMQGSVACGGGAVDISAE